MPDPTAFRLGVNTDVEQVKRHLPNPSVRVSGDPWNPHVEVNGHDISAAVRTVTIQYERNCRAEATVELLADAVELSDLTVSKAEVVLSMPSDVENALIALGWTPPNTCAGGSR